MGFVFATNIQSVDATEPRPTPTEPLRTTEIATPAADEKPQVTRSIDWARLTIALVIFVVLLVVTIGLDISGFVEDLTIYSGLLTLVLGAIIGFLTGEYTGSAPPK
jgi:hypothetical protein